jgi:hypothetical protein
VPSDNRRVMATVDEPPQGRERRRKGPINRVRRFLYGILLAAAAPGAAAVDELAAYGKYRDAPAAAPDAIPRALATVQGLVALRAEPAAAGNPLRLELDTVTARIHGDGSEPEPQFLIAAVASGDGFELMLADLGTLRLDLLLDHVEGGQALALGGTLALASQAAVVPALRVSVPRSRATRYLPFEVSVLDSDLAFRWRT